MRCLLKLLRQLLFSALAVPCCALQVRKIANSNGVEWRLSQSWSTCLTEPSKLLNCPIYLHLLVLDIMRNVCSPPEMPWRGVTADTSSSRNLINGVCPGTGTDLTVFDVCQSSSLGGSLLYAPVPTVKQASPLRSAFSTLAESARHFLITTMNKSTPHSRELNIYILPPLTHSKSSNHLSIHKTHPLCGLNQPVDLI
jgi:hypothetical protein